MPNQVEPLRPEDPCQNNPCGQYAQCTRNGNTFACNCLPSFLGDPPFCRPECLANDDCPALQACVNRKCQDPCQNVCGDGARCTVISHRASCTCPDGLDGDPFIKCSPPRRKQHHSTLSSTKFFSDSNCFILVSFFTFTSNFY